VNGSVAEQALDEIGLTLNKNAVPDDPLPPFKPSGIRVGTPAMTTRGLKEADMVKVATWMKAAILAADDPKQLKKLRQEVKVFCRELPLFVW
jgi:glycine hydroxymethyltransferase